MPTTPRPRIPGDEAIDLLGVERLARAVETMAQGLHEHAVSVARLEVKLDAALAARDDHETRIRRVERRVWSFAGVSSVLSAAAAAGVDRLFTH
jgi:hypothetical protein